MKITHRHDTTGETLSSFFVGKVNSDTTEGRGSNIDFAIATEAKEALDCVRHQSVQGADGDVYLRRFIRCAIEGCPQIFQTDIQIYYGSMYARNQAGKNGLYENVMPDGWRKGYSPMDNDPEYQTYLRLREKFEVR